MVQRVTRTRTKRRRTGENIQPQSLCSRHMFSNRSSRRGAGMSRTLAEQGARVRDMRGGGLAKPGDGPSHGVPRRAHDGLLVRLYPASALHAGVASCLRGHRAVTE